MLGPGWARNQFAKVIIGLAALIQPTRATAAAFHPRRATVVAFSARTGHCNGCIGQHEPLWWLFHTQQAAVVVVYQPIQTLTPAVSTKNQSKPSNTSFYYTDLVTFYEDDMLSFFLRYSIFISWLVFSFILQSSLVNFEHFQRSFFEWIKNCKYCVGFSSQAV
jgi:hypothetical protein